MIIDAETVYWAVPLAVVLLHMLSFYVYTHTADKGTLWRNSLMLIAVGAVVMMSLLTDAGESTRDRFGIVVRNSEKRSSTPSQHGAGTSTDGAQPDAAP